MNYKYLQCNSIKTKEVLGLYLSEEGKSKLKENLKIKAFRRVTKKFNKKTARNKYKVYRLKNSFKKQKIQLQKKSSIYDNKLKQAPVPVYNKIMNKKYSQYESVNSGLHPVDEAFNFVSNNPNYGVHNKHKLQGKYKYYVGKQFINEKKWKQPYRGLNYYARALYWDNRRFCILKFARYLNFFNRELVLLNKDKEYLYNRTDYSIVSINLTPNNITIAVTGADGHILLWGTSGTKGFRGHSKHAYIAIQAVALTMYRRILFRKLKNIKLVYRGRKTKIRMRKVLQIFNQGERWKKYKVLAMIDMSPLPHNGCKKAKKRR